MTTKKRFTIAPDLASGIRNTIQSASSNQGQLHYDMMSLDMIEPDPLNPRKLSINQTEILNGLSSATENYQIKLKEREALVELSESIKRIGVRSAIEVYKDGLKYRIITGERRYWAAMLANQKSLPVRITQKPDDFHLRYTQWVENINRKDLSLWEKYNNLALIANAYKNANKGEFKEEVLQTLLGISEVQAYRYFCLLKANEKIIELIQLGKLNNLKLVQELVSMKDRGAQNQIVSWILNAKDEVTSLANYRLQAGKKTGSLTRSKKETINLGKIQNTHTAKQLFEIVLADQRLSKYHHSFKNVDWSSAKAISKAFKNLLTTLEKEFAAKELA